ncbi:MAG: hypothetical protein ACJAWL_000389 [Motiliproteus sp.]|jgi:hypothetical protein
MLNKNAVLKHVAGKIIRLLEKNVGKSVDDIMKANRTRTRDAG